MSRTLLILPLILLVVLPLASPSATAEDEDAKLTAYFRAFLDEDFRASPLTATTLGDHHHDGELDDLSPEARAGWTARYRRTLEELPKKIDRAKLSRSAQIDFDIFRHELTRRIWLDENTKPFETDPRVYNQYITDGTYLLLTQSTLPQPVNVRNAISRIGHIPRVVETAKATLKNPPRVFVETALRQNRGAIAFYDGGILDVAGNVPNKDELKAAAAKVVPVLKEYQKYLEDDLLPRANGDWRLGKEKFARKLELELDAGLSAEQVLRDAEAEYDRVQRDMYVIARQLWGTTFPGKPLPPDDAAGRRETIVKVLAHYNREHARPEELVRDAREAVKEVKAFIKENDILRLPDPDRCQVIEMPEFQRGNSTAFLNQAPPLDPAAHSVYAISPPPREWNARQVDSYLQEYNARMIKILTIHEAYPGHYVQLEYSNRNPSLIRKVLFSGVFAEGWAVYTEQMMLDQGFGKGDLVLRLNQLKWYLRSVANAVLDHRMHCDDMSDEEAFKFLTEGAFQSEGEALGKIVRAKQSSCQLSTYFVGRMAFYRLRQEVEREMGDRFELGRFHEAVLDHGTLPVKYLPELVRERLKKER